MPSLKEERMKWMLANRSEFGLDKIGFVDFSRPKLQNPDGSFSTEETITVEMDGRHYLIPTIVNGEKLDEEVAIDLMRSGKNKPVGVFDTAEEAEMTANLRTKALGFLRGGDKGIDTRGLDYGTISQGSWLDFSPYMKGIYEGAKEMLGLSSSERLMKHLRDIKSPVLRPQSAFEWADKGAGIAAETLQTGLAASDLGAIAGAVAPAAGRRLAQTLADESGMVEAWHGSPHKFYRGTVPGETKRIEEPFEAGKGKIFVARKPESAKMYGESIEEFVASPDAKILYQEDKEFWKLIGRRRPPNDSILSVPGKATDNVSDAIRKAESAGYDAISFSSDSDIGTVILNDKAFTKKQLASIESVGQVDDLTKLEKEVLEELKKYE